MSDELLELLFDVCEEAGCAEAELSPATLGLDEEDCEFRECVDTFECVLDPPIEGRVVGLTCRVDGPACVEVCLIGLRLAVGDVYPLLVLRVDL